MFREYAGRQTYRKSGRGPKGDLDAATRKGSSQRALIEEDVVQDTLELHAYNKIE